MKQTLIPILFFVSITNLSYSYPGHPWTVDAAFGLASYSNIPNHEGQAGIGRLSLGHTLISRLDWQTGLEAGIQSGTTLHHDLPKESIEALGGVPIDGGMKPLLDIQPMERHTDSD